MARVFPGLVKAVWLCAALAAPGLASGGGAPATATGSDSIEGELVAGGVECPLFRLTDGEEVALTGQPPTAPGTYALTGRWARFSNCMQGRTFDVQGFAVIQGQGD